MQLQDLASAIKMRWVTRVQSSHAACICVHLFYFEPAAAIAERIRASGQCDVIVSVPAGSPCDGKLPEIEKLFIGLPGNVAIARLPNWGDDTLPFMAMLLNGCFDRYESVCKFHGKMTKRLPDVGRLWFNFMLEEVLIQHPPGGRKQKYPAGLTGSVPLLGPASLLVTHPVLWADDKEMASRILAHLDLQLPLDAYPCFFAGTAFWLQRWLIRKLRGLATFGLREADFGYAADGKFGHGFERAVAYVSLINGRGIGDQLGGTFFSDFPPGMVPQFLADAFKVPVYNASVVRSDMP